MNREMALVVTIIVLSCTQILLSTMRLISIGSIRKTKKSNFVSIMACANIEVLNEKVNEFEKDNDIVHMDIKVVKIDESNLQYILIIQSTRKINKVEKW